MGNTDILPDLSLRTSVVPRQPKCNGGQVRATLRNSFTAKERKGVAKFRKD